MFATFKALSTIFVSIQLLMLVEKTRIQTDSLFTFFFVVTNLYAFLYILLSRGPVFISTFLQRGPRLGLTKHLRLGGLACDVSRRAHSCARAGALVAAPPLGYPAPATPRYLKKAFF